jgi:hypothetical protein
VAAAGYPAAFVEGFLLPAVCTVCTCSTEAGARFPAAVIVDYLARGLTRQSVRRACTAPTTSRRLLAGIDLRCNAPSPVRGAARTLVVRTGRRQRRGLRPRRAGHAGQPGAADAEGRTADERRCWRLPLPTGGGADAHRRWR